MTTTITKDALSPERAMNLLRIMKLDQKADLNNYNELRKWVHETGKQASGVSAVTETVAALLILRVTRAFQKRTLTPRNGQSQTRPSENSTESPKKTATATDNNISTASKDMSPSKSAESAMRSIDQGRVPKKVKVSPAVMQALMFLGSDVKNVLHSVCTAGCSSTVADVADCCLELLDMKSSNPGRIGSMFRCMLLTVKKSKDEEECNIFKAFAQQTFDAIRFQAIAATELSFDFEFLYQNCCTTPSFSVPFHALSESYQAAWKLSRYWALRLRFEQYPTEISSSGVRRSQVLGTAASLVWMAALGNVMPRDPIQSISQGPASENLGANASKRPRIDHSSNGVAESGMSLNEDDYLNVLLGVVNKLFTFLAWASPEHQDICAISRQDLERQILLLGSDLCSLKIVRQAPPDEQDPKLLDGISEFSKALHNVVPKMRFIGYNYKAVVDTAVLTTQQLLNPTMAKPTPMPSVLFLAPTVIGEPWGLPTMVPREATKLLCDHTMQRPTQMGGSKVVIADASFLSKQAEEFVRDDGQSIDVQFSLENLSPPTMVITDSMELNEWTLSVLSLSIVKPSDGLMMLLARHDDGKSFLRSVITPILNRAMSRIQKKNRDPKLSIGTRDGLVYINGEINDDVHFCAALIGFYYHSLEAILQDDIIVRKPSFLKSHPFHRALLACCYSCMLKAVGNYPNMMKLSSEFEGTTVYSILETLECSAYTYLKVAEPFYRLLTSWKTYQKNGGSPIVCGLPRILQKHMERTEIQILDSVVWLQNTSGGLSHDILAATIRQLQSHPGAWPPEALQAVLPEEMEDLGFTSWGDINCKSPFASSDETNFLSYLLRKLLKVAYYRIQAMCHALSLPVDPVANQVLVAFRFLLRNAVELLYDRHVDQSIVCSIYSVCKTLKVFPEPTFARITEAYMAVRADELGEKPCQLIVRHVNLVQGGVQDLEPDDSPVGDIIKFYNSLYIPKMQQHLMHSKSLKRSAYQLEVYRMSAAPRMMVPPGHNGHTGMPPAPSMEGQVR